MVKVKFKQLSCPKCSGSAVSATVITMPHTTKKYVKYKCLNCGRTFDQPEDGI